MLTVTIDSVPGYDIKQVYGEVLGTTARPQNVYSEGIRALPGDNGRPTTQVLTKLREDAIARMVQAAYRHGANAVLGMRFDHRSVGPGWTEICAYGTAVFIVPHRSAGARSA